MRTITSARGQARRTVGAWATGLPNLGRTLVLLLVAATVAKIAAIAMASPVIGYANNWDFVRTSSCLGLWQDYGAPVPAHPSAPVDRLVLNGWLNPPLCVPSIDIVFPYLAASFHEVGDVIRFWEISLARMVLIGAVLVVILKASPRTHHRLVAASLFALALGDIAYLGYLNTLYAEFSVLIGLLMCVFMAWLFVTADERPSAVAFWGAVAGIVWLGLAKPQYSPLAPVFALLLAVVCLARWRSPGRALVLVLAGIGAAAALQALHSRDDGLQRGIVAANTTNTILGAVLPEATEPGEAVALLGLPASCVGAIGVTWYTPGVQDAHPCPEVLGLSRLDLIALFVRQPRTFFGPLARAVDGARPIRLDHVGLFEEPRTAKRFRYRATVATSLSTVLDALPAAVFRWLVCASVGFGGAACALLAVRRRFGPGRSQDGLVLAGLGGALVVYALLSSVFGDGLYEVNKHAFALCFGIGVQGLAILVLGAAWSGAWRARPRGETTAPAIP
ncbi:glycan biosynthesis hexose transferase WsfD [Azospirillum sp. ST 5-10]|uniref:glycan biosynthesis hexose transferase WsfD n=1 Tax=unclassified Azospirillum TaxID=2630922 RepID=UPI003F4A44E8